MQYWPSPICTHVSNVVNWQIQPGIEQKLSMPNITADSQGCENQTGTFSIPETDRGIGFACRTRFPARRER